MVGRNEVGERDGKESDGGLEEEKTIITDRDPQFIRSSWLCSGLNRKGVKMEGCLLCLSDQLPCYHDVDDVIYVTYITNRNSRCEKIFPIGKLTRGRNKFSICNTCICRT